MVSEGIMKQRIASTWKRIDLFIEKYDQRPNRLYSLISGNVHLESSLDLQKIKEYMYSSVDDYLSDNEDLIDEDENEDFFYVIEAFGDVSLLITDVETDRPIHLNINSNNFVKGKNPFAYNCENCLESDFFHL